MNLRPLVLLALIIFILYWLQSQMVLDMVFSAKIQWNRFVEYILYFKDKEPFVFCCLPIAVVYLLGKK